MAPRHRIGSIALSIFALVIGAVVTATIIYFVITFNGPPPWEPPRGVDTVVQALRTGEQNGDPGQRVRITMRATPPAATDRLFPAPDTANRIAGLLGTPPDRVVALAGRQPPRFGRMIMGDFAIAWRTPAGWRTVSNVPGPLFKRWHWITLGSMLATILALAFPTWLLARAISRPIRRIAESATEARAGAPLGPMPLDGVGEVRVLSRAISRMHDRLSRHAEGRTTMLAAIAHDLGTPLSRLAFWVEQLPEEARTRANADLEEMRAMLGSVLRFARDESKPATDARIDLGSLLDSLAEDMNIAGAPVTVEPAPRVIVRGDAQALRRLFANLVENAIRYGRSATLTWSTAGESVEVTIDDRGSGFALDHADRLFEPFVRGDPSRNRETGGTGLGLAIVRSIAEAHRGSVALCNHAGGGRVRVTLPIDHG